MKNLIFILLAFTSVIIAQPDNQSSSVELPEFIIVGYRSVDIPNMKKPEPTYTSTLSKEFFSPTYTPEDFKVASPSAPKQHKINLYGESPISQCGIELGAGIYTLPRGKFFCNQSFDDLILKGQVWGLNQREHIEYSGKNNIGGRIGLDYYADNQDAFLSGSKLSFYTQYDWNSYYLFGSPTPSERRITNRGLIGLELNNKANETVKYGFSVSGNLLKLNENNFSEFGLRGSAFLKFKFGDLGWIVIGNIINQSLKNNLSGENNYLYFNASGDVNLLLFEAIETRVGVYYANQGSYHFISPTASLIMKIGRRLSLIGEYAPFTEFLMFTDFITQNNYINLGVQDNAFIKNKINLKAAIKYQYDTYFEIIGGAQLLRASNFPFFQDTTTQGVFDINISEQVTKVAGFLNLLFHLGPNGVLYSESELQLTKEDDGNYIPYNPFFWNQTSYGYYFDFGLNARIKSHVSIGTYTDIQNTVKLPMYFNLALEFGYKLSDNFTITLNLENLLNKKNYIYKNYKEKPIDAILGFSYYW